MTEKTTHFGRAGEFFAMSELLLRGWNVAVPVVDVGDDVFVIDDSDKTTYRLQVKASQAESPEQGTYTARFNLSRKQLATVWDVELFYMLLLRVESAWRFVVIPRADLHALRLRFLHAPRKGPGPKPRADEVAKTDVLGFDVTLSADALSGWGETLSAYDGRWPDALAPVQGGPGARSS